MEVAQELVRWGANVDVPDDVREIGRGIEPLPLTTASPVRFSSFFCFVTAHTFVFLQEGVTVRQLAEEETVLAPLLELIRQVPGSFLFWAGPAATIEAHTISFGILPYLSLFTISPAWQSQNGDEDDVEARLAHLRGRLHVVQQQRDTAQREAEELRGRAQRAELALAKESRQRKELAQRVADLEAQLRQYGAAT